MGAPRVLVAMSGGVDSSVAAALLKDKGFDVVGVTMQVCGRSEDGNSCCGRDSIEDARKVAYRLRIPHYVLNFRDIFRKKVIVNFCAEYKKGRTPNPCIRCNRYIKFALLLEKARQLDADYIATGHYARIEFDPKRRKYLLRKGVDPQKDQSYVLYMLKQGQLRRTLLPLGGLSKNQVRRIARKKNLPVADKPESQELCFIPDNNYGVFLKKTIPRAFGPGPIIDKQGKVIGRHQGIIFYTIGQRKGIGIAAKRPLYVTFIDRKTNTITVGEKEQVYSKSLVAGNVSFIYLSKLDAPLRVKAQVRYRHRASLASIIPQAKGRVRVKFDQPQWAVTPGQAVVFYLPAVTRNRADIVLGGGIIEAQEST